MPKTLPLAKTLVTEFRTELADVYLRQKHLKESIAAKIPSTSNLRVGDFNLTQPNQLVLDDIQVAVEVHGYEDFIIDLVNQMTSVSFTCTGLFIVFGQFDRVVVRKSTVDTRITYLCA